MKLIYLSFCLLLEQNLCNCMNSSESRVADKFTLHLVNLMTDINSLLDQKYMLIYEIIIISWLKASISI